MYKIIRNIDKLGRIVLPKNIREMLGITIGDDLTMEISGDTIVLTRQDKGEKITKYCELICESIYEMTDVAAMVMLKDKIVKVAGITKALEGKPLLLESGRIVYDNKSIVYVKLITSDILSKGEPCGRVVLVQKEIIKNQECLQNTADFMARYIGKLADG